MKSELSALDMHYLIRELNVLIDGKIDKIFLDKNTLLLQFHIPNQGKKLLKIILPEFIFFTEHKGEVPYPNKLCMTLRKFLNNARLRKIEQKGFERIIDFVFERKEGVFSLIIELFSTGNIILTKQDYTIIVAQKYKKFSQRVIRGGVKYDYPKKEINVLNLYLDEIKKTIKNSDKESIVKTLAIDLGLGGVYAEEICLLAGIDKNKKTVSDKETELLYKQIKIILSKKIKPVLYTEVDVTPFELEKYKDSEKNYFKSFSEALDFYLTKKIDATKKEKSKAETKKESIIKIIKKQEQDIEKLEENVLENQEKGELIYNNYQLIDEILATLKKAREKYSWKEIKAKLKNHKTIKEINEKEKKVVIEI
ncbi:NFACT family protein [Candidatus Woesearchaeota archaeon]|nr:NFACT family protein [Candidatus Woesearchaeota archaeon]